MSALKTYTVAAAVAAASIAGYYGYDSLVEGDEPAAVVAEAEVPAAPAGPTLLDKLDDLDKQLDPFGTVDKLSNPLPDALPAIAALAKALADTIPDQVMAEAIARAIVELDTIVGQSLADINGLVPLIPEPSLAIPVLERAQRLYTILKAAGLRVIPYYANGTPAWVKWRQLSQDPFIEDADWIGFYQRLASS